MSISPITQPIQDNLQKYSINISRVVKNLSKIVLPLLAFYAMSNISGADAGPLAYASCIAGCAAMGPFAPACLPVLAFPGLKWHISNRHCQ